MSIFTNMILEFSYTIDEQVEFCCLYLHTVDILGVTKWFTWMLNVQGCISVSFAFNLSKNGGLNYFLLCREIFVNFY